MSMRVASESVEDVRETESTDADVAARWLKELALAKKEHKEAGFYQRSRAIIDKYTARVGFDDDENEASPAKSQYNIQWSNLETLKPAVFSFPKAVVARKHNDADELGRMVAEVQERAIHEQLTIEALEPVLERIELDWLLTGRGVAWVRYCPSYRNLPERVGLTYVEGEPPSFMTPSGEIFEGEVSKDELGHYYEEERKQVAYEQVKVEQVAWDDYLHNKARNEEEVRWKARRVRMTKADIEKRFGEEVSKRFSLSWRSSSAQEEVEDDENIRNEFFQYGEVWEIWDKEKKEVVWVSSGYKEGVLDRVEDPLGLKDFFPCPPALLATTGPDSMIPVPDEVIYQDQLRYLETLDRRIQLLTEAMSVRGVRDASVAELDNLISHTPENKMIAVKNFNRIIEKGGLKGVIDFMPLEVIAGALRNLIQLKEEAKKDFYEISGMADIIRGSTNPQETARAQAIKGKFATLRLREKKRRFERFCRDIVQITGEIVAEHFRPETLARISGARNINPETMQNFVQIVGVLRSDSRRNFHIDIETESSIAVDEEEEKRRVNEFLTSFAAVLDRAGPLVARAPEMADAVKEVIMLSVRQHKVGRNVEGRIEEALERAVMRIKQQANAPQGQQAPDPRLIKIQQDFQIKMEELEIKRRAAEEQRVRDAQEFRLEMQKATAEIQKLYAQIDSINKRASSEVLRDSAAAGRDMTLARARNGGYPAIADSGYYNPTR